ncbi:MAG: peptidase M20 [Chitinophagaceae bacterium BSSC1]|nr:MAG: peptidase M20 [Chitinophagaceae bacterium BSSC1]
MKSLKSLLPFTLFCLSLLMINDSIAQSSKSNGAQTFEKYIDANQDAHLKEFLELISIPSISSIPANKPDVQRAAVWIVNKLKSIGISNAQVIPTAGQPAVFGSWENAPGKPTVLIYAHYDVQPVKESEWIIPPFAPQIKDGKIFGRGASDDKSGVMMSIWAVEAMLKTNGKLPVNVKFIFEGEEEAGSPNFKNMAMANKALLKADFGLNADGGQYDENTPEILMSLRGTAAMEFSIKTADIDAHSGQFGGKTLNSALIMSQIISSLYTKEGNVAVAGFYDKVIPPTAKEKAMMQKVPYNKEEDRKILGSTAETGDTTYSALERIWYRPTLEIIGMQSGYTAAEGHSNIIPGNAMARITCRLVNNQDPAEIQDLIVKHVNSHLPTGATASFKFTRGKGGASPMKFPSDTKEYKYVSDVLEKVYGRQPIQVGTGGSIGSLISVKDILGIYMYSMGLEQSDEKWHASNEFFKVSSVRKGQILYCNYFEHLAEEEGKLKK